MSDARTEHAGGIGASDVRAAPARQSAGTASGQPASGQQAADQADHAGQGGPGQQKDKSGRQLGGQPDGAASRSRSLPPEPRTGLRYELSGLPGRIGVRLKLTALYGGLFFAAGALLLLVTYVLVANILEDIQVVGPAGTPLWMLEEIRRGFIKQVLGQLLWQSVVALLGVGVLALVLGWFVADRALAPLQKVTTTARRLSESTLHERIALEGPEDEIKELADTFDAMLERLNQAFDAQRRFVANASHELRTPLAINRTLLEVALADPEASEDLKSVGRALLATNARHERLIEGLLLLAHSERELSTRTPVDLRDVAGAVLNTVGKDTTAGAPQVEIVTELTSARTAGDPVLLERLVSNLVENAAKHNAEHGTVVVRTGELEGFAACQVENTGPVVPAYEIERLFEPFRRLNADRLESGKGAGLGLSIVRSVVRAHGGTVAAIPRAGGGLVVTVRLPLAATTAGGAGHRAT